MILVVGDDGWPSEKDGSLSRVFDQARKLRAYGYPIEFTSEEDFLERLGLTQSGTVRGHHTLSDLNHILGISTVRLRRWMRVGLIQPITTQFQVPFFEFRQVAFVKQLQELIEDGAALSDIRHGIEQAMDLLPQGQDLTEQWTNIERDGRVLIRLRDQLVDQSGQRYFDFDGAADGDSTVFATAIQAGFHGLCDEALVLEEQGRLEEAAEVYQRAMQLRPDHPTLHYDLGNVVFQLGKIEESIVQFREAIQLDAEFALAWHNMGCVLAHEAEWEEAEAALRSAISLVPNYADSHFTLAEVLRNQGREAEAVPHENAFRENSKANDLRVTRNELLRVVRHDEDET
jgi:tetratricopeptide (TPR) repeat protein